MHESGSNGADAKPQCCRRQKPSWADEFAANCRWDLEDDVLDIEDREDSVVVIAFQVEILLKTSKTCIAWCMVSLSLQILGSMTSRCLYDR